MFHPGKARESVSVATRSDCWSARCDGGARSTTRGMSTSFQRRNRQDIDQQHLTALLEEGHRPKDTSKLTGHDELGTSTSALFLELLASDLAHACGGALVVPSCTWCVSEAPKQRSMGPWNGEVPELIRKQRIRNDTDRSQTTRRGSHVLALLQARPIASPIRHERKALRGRPALALLHAPQRRTDCSSHGNTGGPHYV